MRKFVLLQSACAVFVLAGFAHSQQFDFAAGASTLVSSTPTSASQAYQPPPEKDGMYPSISADFIRKNHFGLNLEVAARAKEGLYNGYQRFRPVFYDVNAVFAPRIAEKASAELLAGIGGERILFYSRYSNCSVDFPACSTYVSSNHFLVHFGGGVRYYFWHNFFIRPEAHLYIIRNNFEFSSGNIGRLGASIGYTFRVK